MKKKESQPAAAGAAAPQPVHEAAVPHLPAGLEVRHVHFEGLLQVGWMHVQRHLDTGRAGITMRYAAGVIWVERKSEGKRGVWICPINRFSSIDLGSEPLKGEAKAAA